MLVVPVKEEAFAAARKLHVYAVPIARSTSDVSYIAFYRGAPTSAITHYAKVITISKNMSFQEVFPGGSSILLPEDSSLKVYHLDPIVELQRRVKKGRNPPISGPRYTKMERLTKARYLDEIWPPEVVVAAKGRGGSRAKVKEADLPKKAKAGRAVKAAKETGPKERDRSTKTKGTQPSKKDTQKASVKTPTKTSRTKAKTPEPTEGPKPASKRRKRARKKGEKEEGTKEEGTKEEGTKEEGTKEEGTKEEGTKEEGEKDAVPQPSVRYIIDGSNVALEARSFKEGGRLSQIELLTAKLAETEGAAVTVIVDANLRHHIDRKDDMEAMIKDRRILQAPAQTDADEFILLTAEFHRSKGESVVIVSNDRYLDYIKRFKPRFDWVKETQQKFMFVFSHDGSEVIEAMTSIT